jgi:peptide/nickel transport system ATP-binding protein/oligopeptide transport system ATP-binding protein
MQQRVMIAMALASEPKLLIADEPTTALDVTIQAQIIELLRDIQQQMGMAILMITHNLGLVADIAQRVAVMYAGQIIEEAPAQQLIARPSHPYTQALIRSIPEIGGNLDRLHALPGNVPSPGQWPSGSVSEPALVSIAPHHAIRCPHSHAAP